MLYLQLICFDWRYTAWAAGGARCERVYCRRNIGRVVNKTASVTIALVERWIWFRRQPNCFPWLHHDIATVFPFWIASLLSREFATTFPRAPRDFLANKGIYQMRRISDLCTQLIDRPWGFRAFTVSHRMNARAFPTKEGYSIKPSFGLL